MIERRGFLYNSLLTLVCIFPIITDYHICVCPLSLGIKSRKHSLVSPIIRICMNCIFTQSCIHTDLTCPSHAPILLMNDTYAFIFSCKLITNGWTFVG